MTDIPQTGSWALQWQPFVSGYLALIRDPDAASVQAVPLSNWGPWNMDLPLSILWTGGP